VQRPLGWFHFTKGRHTVSLVCVGKDNESAGYDVGVYDLVLEKLPPTAGDPEPETVHQLTPTPAEAVPAVPEGAIVYRGLPLAAYLDKLKSAPKAERPEVLRALGSFGEDAAPALAQLSEALRDSDPQVRAAAAWAISQIGPQAASAIPALGTALSDTDPRVRSHAALAFRAMGPAGSPGIPELIRALNDSVDYVRASAVEGLGSMGAAAQTAVKPLIERLLAKDEHGLVLGRVVAALGDMGPAAKEALPVLEQAVKSHRLSTEAQEAILKIEGKPVPTWW
jgi:HEAT repeat protein